MTKIVGRFNNRYGMKRIPFAPHSHNYGGEAEANTLRREMEEIERDTERYVGQARQIIERERVREGER